jgi:pyruvate dehydrogenase E2 component (dihydrolipoamide acetyltransferase)
MVEFRLPDVGEGITEAEIVQWLVKEGEEVKEHQPVVKVETAKAIVDIPSPAAGKIHLMHSEGEVVKVGEVLFTVAEKTAEEKKPIVKPAGAVGYLEEAPEPEEKEQKQIEMPKVTTAKKKILATPDVRKLAHDLGIGLEYVTGSGEGGRITEEDVRRYAEQIGAKEVKKEILPVEIKIQRKYDKYGYIERIPLRGVRKVIAQRMAKSAFTVPHVTHMDEADVTKLWQLREVKKKIAERKGIHLTFLPFIVKACVHALKEHPMFNATLDEEHEEIIVKKYYNIGIAVDTEAGLLVPVIKGADQKDVFQIAKEIFELAEKARQRTIDLADLQGGTFTITNVGSLGGIYATPIINYPEVAILAVGRIFERLVAKADKVFVKKIMPLSLAFDHRVNDGADAARFMNSIKAILEEPNEALFESG